MATTPVAEHSLAELLDRARALASRGGRTILGITGAPGAGKSTLAVELAAALGPELAVLVPMDGFHLAHDLLRQQGSVERKGAPDTFDAWGYAALLERIHAQRPAGSESAAGSAVGSAADFAVGSAARSAPVSTRVSTRVSALDAAADVRRTGPAETIYAPEFRRDLEEPVGSAILVPSSTPLVITEGNYLLLDGEAWTRARAMIDETWFLAPSEPQRLKQLIERHERFGRSPAEARERSLGSDQRNAELIAQTASRADLVVRLAG